MNEPGVLDVRLDIRGLLVLEVFHRMLSKNWPEDRFLATAMGKLVQLTAMVPFLAKEMLAENQDIYQRGRPGQFSGERR